MGDSTSQILSLRYDNPAKTATSFKIGNSFYPAPAYIPEIKGAEHLTVLLENMHVIPPGNPVLVPANRWADLVHPLYFQKRLFGGNPIYDFIQNYSLIYYDPPEFFKGVYGEILLDYALSGKVDGKKNFKTKLKNKDTHGAIELCPPFFQPFIEAQLLTISKSLKVETDVKRNGDIYRAWLDPRASEHYRTYIMNIVNNALKSPNATIIPPVPQLKKDSPESIKRRVLSSNLATSRICSEMKDGNKKIFPYFHLYIDLNIFDNDDQNNQNTIFSLLNEGITKNNKFDNYSGVGLTLVGYDTQIDKFRSNQLKNFISDIVNICHEKTPSFPVILLRSSWYGLYFSDYGVQAFSSLLNGNLKYSSGSGGTISPNDRFGKVPIIDLCIDVGKDFVERHLSDFDEFPHVDGLPTIPRPEYFKDEELWRTNFSKPLRLIHIEEGKRIRKSTLEGTIGPAKHYFSKSKNKYLRDL